MKKKFIILISLSFYTINSNDIDLEKKALELAKQVDPYATDGNLNVVVYKCGFDSLYLERAEQKAGLSILTLLTIVYRDQKKPLPEITLNDLARVAPKYTKPVFLYEESELPWGN
jgi:hypothetical protein